MSTISAGLNSLAAVTIEDYLKPMYAWCTGHEISDKKSIVFSKVLVFTFGIACIGLAFLAQLLGNVLQVCVTENKSTINITYLYLKSFFINF